MRTLFILLFGFLAQVAIAGIIIKPIHPVGEGACNGGVEVTAEGTAGPFYIAVEGPDGYQYAEEEVSGTIHIAGLCTGSYVITVSSDLLCAQSEVVTLECEPAVEISTTTTCSPSGGSITVTPTTQGTYTYQWSDALGNSLPGNEMLTGLAAGDYYLTVSTGSACVLTRRIAVGKTEAFTGEVPYIQNVEVIWESADGQRFTLYTGQWVKTAGGRCLSFVKGQANFPQPLSLLGTEGTTTVSVTASEYLERSVWSCPMWEKIVRFIRRNRF